MKSGATDHDRDRTPGDAMRATLEQRLCEAPTGAPPDTPPPPVPDHVLLHPIGRGAYGEVWLARNALGTLRAIKVVHRARFDDERPYEREFNGILKYEPLSRTHEALVQVLHVGRNDAAGCFYYVMELADSVASSEIRVPGSTLATPAAPALETRNPEPGTYIPRTLRSELGAHERLPPAQAAQWTARLAGGLSHLHAQGLIHRDIKPSNVIFVGGQPKLADIGLVTGVGTAHSFVGTEGFVPPEGPGSPQADLYGLGKLLYELATGRDRMDFPQLPPGVAKLSDGEALLELNEVMARACAPEPKRRYASATELQADLNFFLAGRSLRRTRNLERTLAWLKRFAAVASVLLALAAAAVWFARREERHALSRAEAASERARLETESRQKETALRQRAESAEQATARQQQETQQRLFTSLLEQARATVRSAEIGQRIRALEALRQAAALSNSVELRREVISALGLPDMRYQRQLAYGEEFSLRLLDPTFERIALCRTSRADERRAVEIRATSDQRLLATLPASTNGPVYGAEWSEDGRFLSIKRDHDRAGLRASTEVWDVAAAQRVLLLPTNWWGAISFHPRRPLVLTCPDNAATVWNLETGRAVNRFLLPTGSKRVQFAPAGERFAAQSSFGEGWLVSVHDATNGAPLASRVFPGEVTTIQWHPGGAWLAVLDSDGAIHRMDAQTGEARLLGRHRNKAVSAEFSPDGAYLLTGGWGREILCWDARAMRPAFSTGLYSFMPQFSACSRQCSILMQTGVSLYAFEHPTAHRDFPEDLGARIRHVTFSPESRWLAASAEKRLAVWDLMQAGPAALDDAAFEARCYFAPDNQELFASRHSSRGSSGFRWRLTPAILADAAPRLERLALAQPKGFSSLALASNVLVFTGTNGSTAVARKAATALPERWMPTAAGINDVSPDGRWLAIYSSFSPLLYVYRLPAFQLAGKLLSPAPIGEIGFSPAGDEVAVGMRRGQRVEFWSTTTWTKTRVLPEFVSANYTADGRGLWLSKDHRIAGLYDARSLEPRLLLPTGMIPLAASPDGRHLAVSVDGRHLQVWRLDELREHFRQLGLDWSDR